MQCCINCGTGRFSDALKVGDGDVLLRILIHFSFNASLTDTLWMADYVVVVVEVLLQICLVGYPVFWNWSELLLIMIMI